MTPEEKNFFQAVGRFVVERIKLLIAPYDQRITALEDRMKSWRHLGVWDQDCEYVQNNFVTDHGSTFICVAERTTERPGQSSDWALTAKRGKNGKGAWRGADEQEEAA